MSKKQCSDSTRSVSDGDLANSSVKHGDISDLSLKNHDKQLFFTLPRWMSGRKRTRNKLKYSKVNGYYDRSEDDQETLVALNNCDKKTNDHSNFVRRLFRSSFFSGNSKHHSKRSSSQVPVTHAPCATISSSNTDIHCNNAVLYSFDFQGYFKDKVPAVCGIKNHGNTCFMNSIIQCLSNTDSFAEYFVRDHYKIDFHRRNKVHARKYGTRGEITVQLAVLLKSLWSCQCYSNISHKFKSLVAKYGSQYEGSEQHDAQEFLLWLLDKVHEDLNTAPKQKYKKPKGSLGHTDEEIAAQMLANHLRCNSSFIHDLFQGQIRSSLCCLGCGRFSNTFDPYLCISLPIPQHQSISLFLYLVYKNIDLKMIKVGFAIDTQSTVLDLFEKLSASFGLPRQNVFLTEIVEGDFQKTFSVCDLVNSFKDNINIYAIETPQQTQNSSQENVILIVSCCVKVSQLEYKVFWKPLALEVVREISYKEIGYKILDAICPVLKEPFNLESEFPFSLYVVVGDSPYEVLCTSVDMPLYMPIIDQALMFNEKCPKFLKLILKWHPEYDYLLDTGISFTEEHPSVMKVKNIQKASQDVSLYECFDMYFNEEKLGVEDAWRCPWCQHRLPSIKQLSLWTVPDVLIVHLKRFRQSSNQRIKMTTCVQFPTTGLDIQPYMASRSNHTHQTSNNSYALWSPWKRLRSHADSKSEENVYDLYAVCNHHGNMQSGHYTAYCRNPINGHWHSFDDIKVQEMQASKVISSDAYILFYQRSSLISSSCASSSSSGYSSASSNYSMGLEHWAFRLPFSNPDTPLTSKSQDNLYETGRTSSLDRTTVRPFHRTSRSYSTMPHFSDENSCSTIPRSLREVPSYEENYKDEIPPPPPSTKHFWTVTSV